MTKEEQKELLNVAHHLRQAIVHLAQACMAATRAVRINPDNESFLQQVNKIHETIVGLEVRVGRMAGPTEKHPGFPCDKESCPIHGKERL